MALLAYLTEYFLAEEQLIAACAIDVEQLHALQSAGVAPAPAYKVTLNIACDSFFGGHEERAQRQYFATGAVSWVNDVQGLDARGAFTLFANRYRARLDALKADGYVCSSEKFNAGLDAHLEQEWRAFLEGTYGLCTRSGLPEDIVAKELATAIINELTGEQPFDQRQRPRLAAAVELLDRSCALFAPHERARSSRQRLVTQVRIDYAL
jgi:hypothetical protein